MYAEGEGVHWEQLATGAVTELRSITGDRAAPEVVVAPQPLLNNSDIFEWSAADTRSIVSGLFVWG